MKPEHWQAAKTIVPRAKELATEERSAFLDAECGDDSELRQVVDELLEVDDSTDFLQESLAKLLIDEKVPDRIEGYRILREIGRGGVGVVYLAEHTEEEFQQQVAIKVLTSEIDPKLTELFRSERQILANLTHPGICRLFSAGSLQDGRPYFVMEYLEGTAITRYCEQKGLTVSDRLQLFTDVCRAVTFAHQNLVIHRDLKPGNILVTHRGEAKLLDFGIAKIVDLENEPEENRPHDVERFRTLRYASPEQGKGLKTTTSTDVYSLGLILYQLLVGRVPHQDEEAESSESEFTAEKLFQDASTRVRGDLEAIVLKALQKQPEQRYSSVEKLSDDIQRHRENLPILARKATFGYRIGKLIRRHPLRVAATIAFLVLVFGFGLLMAWQQQETARERDKAQQVGFFLQEIFETPDPFETNDGDITARLLLDRAAKRIATDLDDAPEIRASLSETIGMVYINFRLLDEAEPLLRESVTLHREIFGKGSPEYASSLGNLGSLFVLQRKDKSAEETLREALSIRRHPQILNDLGRALRHQGNLEEAESLFHEAIELLLKREDSVDDLANSRANLGNLFISQGEYAQAERQYTESIQLFRQLWGEEHSQIARLLHNLAYAVEYQGNYSAAKDLYHESLVMKVKFLGNSHPTVGSTANSLAALYVVLGDFEQGEVLYTRALKISRESFGDEHPMVARRLNNVADLMRTTGRFEEAETLYREAFMIRKKILGDTHLEVAGSLNNLALLFYETGRYEISKEYFERAVEIFSQHYDENHHIMVRVNYNQALLLQAMGQYSEAGRLFQECLERSRSLKESHLTAQILQSRASLLLETGEVFGAEPLAREALDIFQELLPQGNWRIADAESVLGEVLLKRGRIQEAEALLVESCSVIRDARGLRARTTREALRRIEDLSTARGTSRDAAGECQISSSS